MAKAPGGSGSPKDREAREGSSRLVKKAPEAPRKPDPKERERSERAERPERSARAPKAEPREPSGRMRKPSAERLPSHERSGSARKTALFGAVGGAVVTLALTGIGVLMFGGDGREKPRRTEDRPIGQAGPKPTAKPRPQDLGLPRVQKSEPPRPAAKPLDLGVTDVAKRVAELLAEYDALDQAVPDGATPDEKLRALQERERRMQELVEKLARLGPAAVPYLLEAVQQDALQNRITRQIAVIQALALIPGADSLAALAKILAANGEWTVKMAVVQQLGKRGAEAVDVLAQQLAVEQEFRIRAALLKQLGDLGGPEVAAVIARAARDDPDANVRRAAVRALSRFQDAVALQTLEDLSRVAEDVAVRQAAIQAYAAQAGDRGVLLLDELVRTDPNLRVKAIAILGLQRVGSDEALRSLRAIADDPSQSEDVRARARGAIAAIERQRSGGGAAPEPARTRLEPIDPAGIGPLKPVGE